LRGAFTSATEAKRGLFEVAEGGTIFLDDIGHLGPEMQAKLLHAIENREIRPIGATINRPINVHVIAATNRDLQAAVDSGEFRRDLYHRLRVVHIEIPPLRDRAEDIPLLAAHFASLHCRRFGVPTKSFTQPAMAALKNQGWRGNIRELSHMLESAILQIDGPSIDASDLPLSHETVAGDIQISLPGGRVITMDFESGSPTLDEVELTILTSAFDYTRQNLSRAARLLGITREALRYRLNKNLERAS
jgi:DNA-binding NtrC family response regulator